MDDLADLAADGLASASDRLDRVERFYAGVLGHLAAMAWGSGVPAPANTQISYGDRTAALRRLVEGPRSSEIQKALARALTAPLDRTSAMCRTVESVGDYVEYPRPVGDVLNFLEWFVVFRNELRHRGAGPEPQAKRHAELLAETCRQLRGQMDLLARFRFAKLLRRVEDEGRCAHEFGLPEDEPTPGVFTMDHRHGELAAIGGTYLLDLDRGLLPVSATAPWLIVERCKDQDCHRLHAFIRDGRSRQRGWVADGVHRRPNFSGAHSAALRGRPRIPLVPSPAAIERQATRAVILGALYATGMAAACALGVQAVW